MPLTRPRHQAVLRPLQAGARGLPWLHQGHHRAGRPGVVRVADAQPVDVRLFHPAKGFLDADPEYLSNRLEDSPAAQGKDKFLTFYRYFLLRLFHEGLASSQRNALLTSTDLLGDVPYLNGGLFELTRLEAKHTDIDIPDEAFERLFAFFDQYDWHLEPARCATTTRSTPTCSATSSRSTSTRSRWGPTTPRRTLPSTSPRTRSSLTCSTPPRRSALSPSSLTLLSGGSRDDPDHYIYQPVRQGRRRSGATARQEIASRHRAMSAKRGGWNQPAAASLPCPPKPGASTSPAGSAAWRCATSSRLATVHQINDLITYNLDIRQFAQDVIARCEGPDCCGRSGRRSRLSRFSTQPAARAHSCLPPSTSWSRSMKPASTACKRSWTTWTVRASGPPKKFADFRECWPRSKHTPTGAISSSNRSSSTTSMASTSWKRR